MDVAMPDLNGIEATRQLTARDPSLKIIALSMHSDRRFVIEMLRAGAMAFMLKDSAFEELVVAIQNVYKGRTFLSSSIMDVVVTDYVRNLGGTDSPADSQLSVPLVKWVNFMQNYPLSDALKVKVDEKDHQSVWQWLQGVLGNLLSSPIKSEAFLQQTV